MASDALLEIRDLKKSFRSRTALNGLSLVIPKKSVTAFVGANGAGKTTTFSLIGQFFKPDSGTITIEGTSLAEYRRQGGIIGILPQDVLFFENRSVERHLILFAKLAGLSGSEAYEESQRVLALVQLSDRADELVANLSHGMKVRLGVAQALVGNPPLVLLDEPTAGLDPKMVNHFRGVIEALRGTTTLVISSHDLGQLQMICDYVCMIDHGKLVKQGRLSELLVQTSRVTYRLEADTVDLDQLEKQFPEFKFSKPDELTLVAEFERNEFQVTEVNSRVLFWLFRNQVGVLNVESQRSLEQTFLEETGDTQ